MSNETASIYGRMAAVLADVGAIEKTRKNQAQGFQFRGIDDAMNELHGTFAKHSIFLTHELLEHAMTERETRNGGKSFHHIAKVRFTFWAPDGSNVAAVGIGEAADTGDKGAGKAMAYALKVCLLQTFLIPTEEEKDPDYRVTEWSGNQKPAAKPTPAVKKAPTQPVAPAPIVDTRPPPAWSGPAMTLSADEPIPAGLTTDGAVKPEPKTSGEAYRDNDDSKKWLMREMAFYGIHPRLANFAAIGEELHKLCLHKMRVDCRKVVSDWADAKGFKKG